jgi:hypothetical protein
MVNRVLDGSSYPRLKAHQSGKLYLYSQTYNWAKKIDQ